MVTRKESGRRMGEIGEGMGIKSALVVRSSE